MDLELSDDQELFLETTEKFLAREWPTSTVRRLIDEETGFDRDLWTRGAALGWTSMLVPEQFGGGSISGDGVRDLGIVAEALGRSLVAGPVLATNIVAFALASDASSDLAAKHLPDLVSGREVAAWAVGGENDPSGGVEVTSTSEGFRLSGTTAPVQDAHVADQILVTGRSSEGVTQLLVPAHAPGVSVETLDGLDLTRRWCRVQFDDVTLPEVSAVGPAEPDGDAVELQLTLAVALQCAETVGATDRAYAMTLAYVQDRKAFGRPIGSYQVLKHRLADMLLWLESAKAVTVAALDAVQRDDGASQAASLAKAYVADRCPAIVRDCLQLHGGIGCTWEHDIHLFLRRVDSNSAIYGGVDHHCDRLASVVGL